MTVIDTRNPESRRTSDTAARLASESVQLLADGHALDAARKLNSAAKLAALANQQQLAEDQVARNRTRWLATELDDPTNAYRIGAVR